ncbi:MAG TPA: imidazole glycerol phosphate synthase subunit HisH [Bacteroidia bacterium]|jgi:glutamine amidotransferase|nr:imidazole glycerol phosphate synthase subunit HisH [Bacteroidia bacterium]
MNLKQKIIIIDYGVGNTHSVSNALFFLGYRHIKISANETDIKNADAIILPGVGAFDEAIKNLKARNLDILLNEQVKTRKKPLLGICVGMQLLAEGSEENGWHEGLGWISGKVKRLHLANQFAVPHVGWNNVTSSVQKPLFMNTIPDGHYYFDHSYYFDCPEKNISAFFKYGIKIAAAVQHENICGVQFHPEKSQTNGLRLFRSFLNSIS